MEENNIIEAEYREVSNANGECELNRITTEIRYITEQLNRTLLTGIIEIGKRFERAKSLVKHGEWGNYVEAATGYSQSMAENYIKIYKEYGLEQQSIFGDLSKSQSLGNLGVTKLLELTAVPADEREEFVEKNNVTEDTTVKELQELIRRQKAENEDAEMKFREKEYQLEQSIRRNNDIITEKQEEIERLKTELEKRSLEAAKTTDKPAADELAAMIAEAEEKAKANLQETINQLEKDKEKLQKNVDKQKKQFEKLQSDYESEQKKVSDMKSAAEKAEAEAAEMQKTIERLKKESLLGSNENMVRLNMCFETAQSDIQAVKSALDKLKDTEQYEKLRQVIFKTLSAAVEGV